MALNATKQQFQIDRWQNSNVDFLIPVPNYRLGIKKSGYRAFLACRPVVLEDLGTGFASFLDNGPRTASLFQRTIGPILSQRPLPSGKFLIGCRSRQQQEALLKTKVLGGVNVACSIPQPTTGGVIRPVPTNVDCQFLVDRSTIKEVRRLTNRDGTRSQAIKITFFLRSYHAVLNWTTRSSWCMPMCHRSGDAPRATSWATLKPSCMRVLWSQNPPRFRVFHHL